MALNVNRNVQDSFYRYKMPRLIAKVEGKGNGIKTVIVNMVDVARALARPPTYVTKYFGCELGAQTQFDIKAERYIVNGCHDGAKLQDMLDGFIKRFVLCEQCDNPETVLKVRLMINQRPSDVTIIHNSGEEEHDWSLLQSLWPPVRPRHETQAHHLHREEPTGEGDRLPGMRVADWLLS